MSKHVTDWLGAYLDGELSTPRLWRVEAHLTDCPTCQAELESLRRLSALLRESPAAEEMTPPERFVAQVQLRVPRRPEQPGAQRALEMGWRAVPVGLLGALAFVQAVFIVGGGLLFLAQLGLGGDLAAQLLPASGGGQWLTDILRLSEPSLMDVGHIILEMLSNGGPLGWGVTVNLALVILIGVLYWSWLASWWARRRHRQLAVLNGAN